jgi:peptide subunit release factor 1 (eRF1)
MTQRHPILLDLEELAAFEPSPFPVISLYLDTGPDQTGREHFAQYARKELRARARTYPARSPERESFDEDIGRIERYLEAEILPSTSTAAIFASAGSGGFFDAIQLATPSSNHLLYVGRQPHLYPLARVEDQYRRYAAVLADTNSARIYVFGIGGRLAESVLTSDKTKRFQAGGWSQKRFQRQVDQHRQQHAREVAEALSRLVREEQLEQVVLAGDEVILPMLRAELPDEVRTRVIDELRLGIRTPEHEVLRATLEAMRADDARTDAEKVAMLLDEYRAHALGVVGVRATLMALEAGQVNELLISADPEQLLDDLEPGDAELLAPDTPLVAAGPGAEPGSGSPDSQSAKALLAEALVFQARRAAARITFIEDPALLAGVGGVGGMLRFRIA